MAGFCAFVFRRLQIIFIILYISRYDLAISASSNHVIGKRDDAFECFTCNANSTEECQLKGSPESCDKGTNRCFTEIRYHGGTYKVKKIVKNCILEPSCDQKKRKTQTNCEQKENDFDCFKCCDKELCNKDAGSVQLVSNHIITLAMVFFAIFFPLHIVR